jgi:hypothetical protein
MSATNPVHCTPQTRCSHKHGPGCGHETVPTPTTSIIW